MQQSIHYLHYLSFAGGKWWHKQNLKPVTSQASQAPSFASSGNAFGSNRSLTGIFNSTSSSTVSSVPMATITVEAATPPSSTSQVLAVTPVPVLSSAPTPTPVVDFADDPFKDYRYEDPFNIEDPFADVENDSSEDPFASATNNNAANNNNNINILSNKFDTKFSKTSTTTTSMEKLDELFKGVRMSGDGANDTLNLNNNNASRLNNNSSALSSKSAAGSIGKTKPFGLDPFDAFNDNFSKNTNQAEDSLFSAFGNDSGDATDNSLLDAFRVTTSSSTVHSTSPATSSAMMKSFEDEFSKMDASNVLNNNITAAASFTSGNEFVAKFDDAFSAFSTTQPTQPSSTGSANGNRYGVGFGATLPPPAKSSKSETNGPLTGSLKRPDGSADPPKVVERFNADYSKGETFDADLEAILQRSLVEK
uniref:Uncharacterized protein n=1 Tax=Anopheles culicifacies TaxID=139723 RepID=A0A182M7G8_9DIPT